MAAARYDLEIEQGATFHFSLTLKNDQNAVMDLTNYAGRGQIRKYVSSDAPLVCFTVAFSSPPTDGVVNISLTANQTSSLPVAQTMDNTRPKSSYPYDIELTKPDGTVLRIMEGLAKVSPQVTR